MNPNRGENISFQVPEADIANGSEAGADSGVETGLTSQENSPSKQTSAPIIPTAPTNLPVTAVPVIPTDDTNGRQSQPNLDHSYNPDRIEKQWIDKAKEIVAKTKTDPYIQKTEMSKFKAEYIKNRFNRTLKEDS